MFPIPAHGSNILIFLLLSYNIQLYYIIYSHISNGVE